MKNGKIVILTCGKEQGETLAKTFRAGGYEVCGISDDGAEGVSLIEKEAPNVVLCDLFLKSLDGQGVMEKVNEKGITTVFVMISAVADAELLDRLMQRGAKYCLLKPYTPETALARVNDLTATEAKTARTPTSAEKAHIPTLEEKISGIFISIGIPPHIKGYAYLREGIKMTVENPSIINNVTKVLYPKIGEKYDTSASKVERAIRHAIEVAWNRGRTDAINFIFGARVYIGTEKPTNSEFIALVADKLILESMG
jgi:two-component system response regulator (stage 0 sporulation protein A)